MQISIHLCSENVTTMIALKSLDEYFTLLASHHAHHKGHVNNHVWLWLDNSIPRAPIFEASWRQKASAGYVLHPHRNPSVLSLLSKAQPCPDFSEQAQQKISFLEHLILKTRLPNPHPKHRVDLEIAHPLSLPQSDHHTKKWNLNNGLKKSDVLYRLEINSSHFLPSGAGYFGKDVITEGSFDGLVLSLANHLIQKAHFLPPDLSQTPYEEQVFNQIMNVLPQHHPLHPLWLEASNRYLKSSIQSALPQRFATPKSKKM